MYEDNNRDESIYNLIPRDFTEKEQTSRHKSKFNRAGGQGQGQNETSRKNKAPHKTMGPAKVETRPPEYYLKKHENEPRLPENSGKTFQYSDGKKKPPVPRQDERPVMHLRTNKDFITQNAVENIMAVPKKPERRLVHTRSGDKMLLEPSGLEPNFLHKKEFGKVPVYLEKRKEEMQRAQDEYDSSVAEHFRRGAMRKLTDEERESLIAGLKENWTTVHRQFLGLSVVIDTTPKMLYKEKLEKEMKQLERDVEMLETHNAIFVANN